MIRKTMGIVSVCPILAGLVLLSQMSNAAAPESDLFRNASPLIRKQLKSVRRHNGILDVDEVAVAWTDEVLSETYAPPKVARYVFLPRSSAQEVDMVRLSYGVNKEVITVSQTRFFFGIQVDLPGDGKGLTIDEIQALARRLLAGGQNLVLTPPKDGGDENRGSASGESVGRPYLQYLTWAYEEDCVRFWLPKILPGERGVPADLRSNGDWFDRAEKSSNRERLGELGQGK